MVIWYLNTGVERFQCTKSKLSPNASVTRGYNMSTRMVSYVAYTGSTDRLVQYATDPLPTWALDVEYYIDESGTLQDRFRGRGISDAMVNRVYDLAYDRGHSAGQNEVDAIFKGMMYDLFLMSSESKSPANLG